MKTRKKHTKRGGGWLTQTFPMFRRGPSTSDILKKINEVLVSKQPNLTETDVNTILNVPDLNIQSMMNLISISTTISNSNKSLIKSILQKNRETQPNTNVEPDQVQL